MPSSFACRLSGNTRGRSIISFRWAGLPCRARRIKIILQRQLPDLRVQRLQVDRWLARRLARCAEYISRTLLKLSLPFGDLVRMYIELLGQFGQCTFTPYRCQCHLCLERR